MDYAHDHHTPAHCFSKEAVEAFQNIENQILEAANYYLWLEKAGGQGFLYALELCFEDGEPLLVSGS